MEWKGSFIGFTFGNRHSSELGIFRTSNSNRYETNLVGTKDVVTTLDVVDGQYYWGSTYSKRDMPISFAFYGMTDTQLARLRQAFNDKKIHSLIFDEEPYKVWSAKLTGVMTTKHLCLERNGQRYYCGEGTFTFTALYPFARSRYQYVEDYSKENIREWIEEGDLYEPGVHEVIYPAILEYDFSEEELEDGTGYLITFDDWLCEQHLMTDSELDLTRINSSIEVFYNYNSLGETNQWINESKIPKKEEGYGEYSAGKYKLYNAGDLEMPFRIYFSVTSTPQDFYVQCADCKILLKGVVSKNDDKYIVLDSHTLTIQGCDINYKKTKNLYNERIEEGNLFTLPVGEIELISSQASKLEFNYLYL